MKLRVLGPNQTEIEADSVIVFFSYNTPVAAEVGGRAFITEFKHSATTSKHIKLWLAGRKGEERAQNFFENLLVAKKQGGAK